MSSLVAWIRVTEKARLRVVEIDAERHDALVQALDVTTVPTLVLIHDGTVLGRLEGRSTGREIEGLIGSHVPSKPARRSKTAR
jgi:thioredoxin-like negative regulator of GroEL